ncbi:MAG: pyridoxal phosphate-dependent aminotransferase [Phycisphaerales bacterium]
MSGPAQKPDAVRPASRMQHVNAYCPPRGVREQRLDALRLDANEGQPQDELFAQAIKQMSREMVRRYPSTAALESQLAAEFGIDTSRVIVTAGADDALDRICRAVLEPGQTAIVMDPTFEMIPRYIQLAGAEVIRIPWLDRAFLAEELMTCSSGATAIFVDSPNNPTGAIADAEALVAIAQQFPSTLLVADLAYVDFADTDPTSLLLSLPNVVVTRTFSKACGLAGLRVGYALGPAEIIGWLRATGHPYPVSSISLAIAGAAMNADHTITAAYLQRVRTERQQLDGWLRERDILTSRSQGNFVFAKFPNAWAIADSLAASGILVRRFERNTALGDRLRITCPGCAEEFDRLIAGLEQAIATTQGDNQ